jgi:hypothetical protein
LAQVWGAAVTAKAAGGQHAPGLRWGCVHNGGLLPYCTQGPAAADVLRFAGVFPTCRQQ